MDYRVLLHIACNFNITIIILLMWKYNIERSGVQPYYVGVVVSVSVGGSCCRPAVSPHTTQPRCSPPCLPALPTSRLTLHTVSQSLSLSVSQSLGLL